MTIINTLRKQIETQSHRTENWMGEGWAVVPQELEGKLMSLYPFVVVTVKDGIVSAVEDDVESRKQSIVPSLEEAKKSKLQELWQICNATITAGCDVTLSDGTKGHISLTLQDQYNLSEAKSAIEKGAAGAPYHLDGGIPCHFYLAADIVIFYVESKRFVLYNTTYCNHLNAWVRRCESIAEVQAITYGSQLPVDLASNLQTVLEKSYKELQHVG